MQLFIFIRLWYNTGVYRVYTGPPPRNVKMDLFALHGVRSYRRIHIVTFISGEAMDNPILTRRYDVLLCDADDTLFDFHRAEENAFSIACVRAGLTATPALLTCYSEINEALWKLLEQGGITQAVLRVRRYEQFLAAIGREDLDARAMADAFVDALSHQSVALPGAVEAVARWSRVLPVIVVTNGIARVQHGRMDASPIKQYISGLVISEEIGAAKPDPRMVEAALEMTGVQGRRRALMLGDSLSSDIAAAANAGIDACWFNPKGTKNEKKLPVAYTIRSLEAVEAILLGRAQKEGSA